VSRVELPDALAAGELTCRGAISIVGVATATRPDPRREICSDRTVVQTLALVPKLSRHDLPARPVTRTDPGDSVRHLVQKDLMDFVVGILRGKVAGNRNALGGVVAQTGSGFGVVECKVPRRIQMQHDERVRPSSYSL